MTELMKLVGPAIRLYSACGRLTTTVSTWIKALGIPPLIVLAIVLQHSLPKTFPQVWYGGWPIFATFATIMISFTMWQRGLAWFIPIFAWTCLSGIATGIVGYGLPADGGVTKWPVGYVTNMSVHTSARMFSLSSLTVFIAMSALGISFRWGRIRQIGAWASVAGIFTAASILYEGLWLKHPVHIQTAIGDNPSMTALFAVFGIVYAIGMHDRIYSRLIRYLIIAVLLALLGGLLYLVRASTPIAAAGAGLFVLLLAERKPAWTIGTLFILAAAAVYFWPSWEAIKLDASGRFEFWPALWNFWNVTGLRSWIGAGLGTTKIFGPLLTGSGLFFGHCDFLQIGMELGRIGLICTGIAGIKMIYECAKEPAYLAVLAAFVVGMLTDFPQHSPLHSLWLIVLVRRAI